MVVYISPEIVKNSFKRLAFVQKSEGDTKTGLERTSSLMYFFAFDIVSKRHKNDIVDIDTNSFDGKTSRDEFILEYTKLVVLKNSPSGKPRHVACLGEVQVGGKRPEGKIRSNFLSVPVDKASIAEKVYEYPRRPIPLLLLGPAATGKKYGMMHHPKFEQNLSKFLSEFKSRTPYTDLAIFLCRNDQIEIADGSDGMKVLFEAIKNKFTDRLSSYLIAKIESEKLFSSGKIDWNNFVSESFCDILSESTFSSRKEELQSMSKTELIELVLKLENVQ